MRRNRIAYIAAAIAALVLVMGASCDDLQQQQTRDLEGVPVQEPDKIEMYVNIDGHPNIVAQCINGVGFVTTTRDGQSSLQESPGLTEKWCAQ
jgi:hypothetical protein